MCSHEISAILIMTDPIVSMCHLLCFCVHCQRKMMLEFQCINDTHVCTTLTFLRFYNNNDNLLICQLIISLVILIESQLRVQLAHYLCSVVYVTAHGTKTLQPWSGFTNMNFLCHVFMISVRRQYIIFVIFQQMPSERSAYIVTHSKKVICSCLSAVCINECLWSGYYNVEKIKPRTGIIKPCLYIYRTVLPNMAICDIWLCSTLKIYPCMDFVQFQTLFKMQKMLILIEFVTNICHCLQLNHKA